MKYSLIFCAFIAGLALTSCAPRDPSVYDVKSPCVSYDFDGTAPCVRRKPIENDVA
jgi:hypothetical protein